MDQLSLTAGFLLNVVIASFVGFACWRAWRWTLGIWRPLGIVVGIGILLRAWSGLGLFVVSYYNLPILASLHTADGFWQLAPDARVYFELASNAANGAPIPPGSPSPSFVAVFSLWLRATGLVPASALLFNLSLYVGSCVLVIATLRPLATVLSQRAALVTVSIFTFSPVLILLGTQPLKDVFSAFLVVLAAAALMSLLARARESLLHWKTVVSLACLTLAIYLMAGVRAYYALFMWAAVASALALRAVTAPRPFALKWGTLSCGALVIFWVAFMAGAGPYYVSYANLISRSVGVQMPMLPSTPRHVVHQPRGGTGMYVAMERVDSLREGFIRTGGATNLASHSSDRAGVGKALFTGLAAVFIPITGLMQLSLVQFSGGRGFLLITDIDTLFVDLALIAVAWLFIASGRWSWRQLPFACFALGLGLVTVCLMAYIVTNYGTLFRLRLLATVPLWLVPLALTHARSGESVPVSEKLGVEAWAPAVPQPTDVAIHTRGQA